MPRPKSIPLPFIGDFLQLLQTAQNPEQFNTWLNSCHGYQSTGGSLPHLLCCQGIWNEPQLVACNSTVMYEVLTTQVNDWVKPPALKGVSRDLLGDHSLLLAEGEMHRIQRKALQPAFTSGHIDSLASLFARKGVELASKVKEEGINMEVDVAKYITAATLDTIGLATFSQDFGALQDPNNELAAALQLLFDAEPLQTIVDLLATRLPKWLLSCLPPSIFHRRTKAAHILRAATLARVEALEREGMTQKTIAGVALATGQFTSTIVMEQMLTFLLAGRDTTATAMKWAVLEFSRNEAIQARLREEALGCDVTQTEPRYVSAFLSEILRKHAPATATIREAARDTTLCGQFVPKGTALWLPLCTVNTSTELWGPDAGVFSPQRWVDDPVLGGATDRYSFQSFLKGTRACIGERFARLELEAFIQAWVVEFKSVAINPGKEETATKAQPNIVKIRVEDW